MPFVVDDPSDVSGQPATWYVKRLNESFALVIDMGQAQASNAKQHIAKCAFVAGMAIASGRKLLILSNESIKGPIDYRDLMAVYKNAADAARKTKAFLTPSMPKSAAVDEYLLGDIRGGDNGADGILQALDLGDYIAETEKADLGSYFVKTQHFNEIATSKFDIVVGRKGTGKSAIAHVLETETFADPDLIIVQINPATFELGQMALSIEGFDHAYRMRMLDVLWK